VSGEEDIDIQEGSYEPVDSWTFSNGREFRVGGAIAGLKIKRNSAGKAIELVVIYEQTRGRQPESYDLE
jgi:hypothetical protein